MLDIVSIGRLIVITDYTYGSRVIGELNDNVMAEALSRCLQSFKWQFRVDTNVRFLTSCTGFCPPCDVFADALSPVGPLISISPALNPGCAIQCRLSKTMRCSEVGTIMRAGVALTSAHKLDRISGDEGSTTKCACLGVKIALHACTDEVQVSWSADDDLCGSPSRGRWVETQIASLMKPVLS